MPETITSLIEKLEGVTEGSQELDAAICITLQYGGLNSEGGTNIRTDEDWEGDLIYEVGTDECCCSIPKLTTSLDAALALAERVLPGWRFAFATMTPPWAQAYPPGSVEDCLDATAASTLPLALCLSVLQVRAQSEVRV